MEKFLSNVWRLFFIIIVFSLLFGLTVGFLCSSGMLTIDYHPEVTKRVFKKGVNNFNKNSKAMMESLRSQDQVIESNQDENFKNRELRSKSVRPTFIYEVQHGETLYDIGRKYGVHWKVIKRINKIQNPNQLHPNDELIIPRL